MGRWSIRPLVYPSVCLSVCGSIRPLFYCWISRSFVHWSLCNTQVKIRCSYFGGAGRAAPRNERDLVGRKGRRGKEKGKRKRGKEKGEEKEEREERKKKKKRRKQ